MSELLEHSKKRVKNNKAHQYVVSAEEYEGLVGIIEQQQARLDELAATVERLREVIYSERKSLMVRVDAEKILKSTPIQNLNAIKREVAREAWLGALSAYSRLRGNPNCEDELSIACERHANQRYPDKE